MDRYKYKPHYNKKDKKDNSLWGKRWEIVGFLFVLNFIFGGIGSAIGISIRIAIPILIIYLIYNFINSNQNLKNYNFKPNFNNIDKNVYKKVDKKLKEYFKNNDELAIFDNIVLKTHQGEYKSFSDISLYHNNEYVNTLSELELNNPDMLKKIFTALYNKDLSEFNKEVKQETIKQQSKNNNYHISQQFVEEINNLNIEIPDEAISNGLFETLALLKQIGSAEIEFPENNEKLQKLYDYYLPMLLNNLKQYKTLQTVQSNQNFENIKQKLQKNITLINEAMKTIASSLCEEDFVNLSVDISTLESLLKKDGLAGEHIMKKSNENLKK